MRRFNCYLVAFYTQTDVSWGRPLAAVMDFESLSMHKPTARSRYLVLSIYIKFHLRFLIHWASNHISFRLYIFVFGPELQLLTRLQLLAESKVVKIDIKVYSQIKNLTTWVDAIYIAVHCKLLLSHTSLMGVTGICYLLEFFTTAKETEVVIL